MAQINLVEAIQQNLGFSPLQKIDPNTQEVKKQSVQTSNDKLAQAAIPGMLAGLYLLASSEEGAATILRGNKSTSWVATITKSREGEAVHKIAAYAGTDEETAFATMERVADEAVRLIREQLPANASHAQVKEFFTAQRDKILIHLPAALQLGQLLKEDTLDDRTNKMEGPVSGFMHTVEKVFSGGVKEKDEWGVKGGNKADKA